MRLTRADQSGAVVEVHDALVRRISRVGLAGRQNRGEGVVLIGIADRLGRKVIVLVPWVTVSTNTGDVLAMKVALPPKVAVMLCAPPKKAAPDAGRKVAVWPLPTVPVPSTLVPS